MSTLNQAHNQWANRPADETFDSLAALHNAVEDQRAESKAVIVDVGALRVEANGDSVQLVGRANRPAHLTNHAFGQLCQRVSAPASYLRELPPTLATQNLNHGLALYGRGNIGEEDRKASLLLRQNGDFFLRAVLTESYTRIWNSDVTSRLVAIQIGRAHV